MGYFCWTSFLFESRITKHWCVDTETASGSYKEHWKANTVLAVCLYHSTRENGHVMSGWTKINSLVPPADYFQNKLEVARNAKDTRLIMICHFSSLSDCTFGLYFRWKIQKSLCTTSMQFYFENIFIRLNDFPLPISVYPLLQNTFFGKFKMDLHQPIAKEANILLRHIPIQRPRTFTLPLNLYSHQSKLGEYIRR